MTENNGRVWQKKVMPEKNRVTTQGRKVVEVGSLLLANDKNNVIANKVLRYFQCLSFRNKIIVINFLLANADLLKISIFYLF